MNKIIALLFILFAVPAWAAPTFDAVNSNTGEPTSAPSVNLTVGGGCTNPIIVAEVGWYLGPGSTGSVSSLSIGGSAATFIGGVSLDSGAVGRRLEMWYRVGVATGSNTVTATMSESMSKATIIALSYCGVHQSTPIGTPATADTPNPTLSSVSVSSDGTELVVDAVMTAGAALTADGSQTVRITETSFASYYNLASSDKIGSGTTTMAWTLDVNDSNGIIAVPLKAVAAAPSTSPRRMVVVVQ